MKHHAKKSNLYIHVFLMFKLKLASIYNCYGLILYIKYVNM